MSTSALLACAVVFFVWGALEPVHSHDAWRHIGVAEGFLLAVAIPYLIAAIHWVTRP